MAVLGLAGMAEAGMFAGQLLTSFVVLVTGAVALVGLVSRSRTAVRIGAAIWVANALLLAPWQGLLPPAPSDDPDVGPFQRDEAVLARWWVVTSGLLAASAVAAWRAGPTPGPTAVAAPPDPAGRPDPAGTDRTDEPARVWVAAAVVGSMVSAAALWLAFIRLIAG